MKKKYDLYLILSSFGIFSLLALVLSPIYFSLSANVVIADSIWIVVLGFVTDVIGIAVYPLSYAIILISACKFTTSKIVNQLVLFGCSVIHYHIANTLVSLITSTDFVWVELIYVLFSVLLELLLHTAVLGISLNIIEKNKNNIFHSLKRTALYSGTIHTAARIISRFSYDVQIGSPQDGIEIAQMLLAYGSDILAGVGIYIIMLLIFINFIQKEKAE